MVKKVILKLFISLFFLKYYQTVISEITKANMYINTDSHPCSLNYSLIICTGEEGS